MQNTKIQVTTIGHYQRDADMKVTLDILPKKLNENRQFIGKGKFSKDKMINLNIEVADTEAGENNMESLLEYIRQRPWTPENKPDFVTTKNLLRVIPSMKQYREDSILVQAVRMSGVTFLLKTDGGGRYLGSNQGQVFEHFMTGKQGEDVGGDGTVRKAVFTAEIPKPNERIKKFRVMYSGEICAMSDNNEHLELKIQNHGLAFKFWNWKSCSVYWQAIFSNVETIIMGAKTGSDGDPLYKFKNYPMHSVYEIITLKTKEMPSKLEEARSTNNSKKTYFRHQRIPSENQIWTVQDSEKKMEDFFEMVSQNVLEDGDCFYFLKPENSEEWISGRDEDTIGSFRDLVRECLSTSN